MRTMTALMCLLSLGCSGQLFSGGSDEMARDVAELQRKLLALERQTTMDQVEIERLRQKVAALEARPAQTGAAPAPPPTASRGLDEEELPPRRQVEVIEIADLEEPIEESIPDPGHPPSVGATSDVTAAAQALYDRGYSLYHQGRHAQAEETFDRFLVEFGATDLGDNAQYWIGECRLAALDQAGALEAFRETVRRYPDGNKTPDALLKVGVVLERMGDIEGARATYREVERRYPDSPARASAVENLENLLDSPG